MGDDEVFSSSIKIKGESSCLNLDDRKSSRVAGKGWLQNEDEDGAEDSVWDDADVLKWNKDEDGGDNVVSDDLDGLN
nr:hypothetical protein CFP56_09743 [Quercus suber]